MKYIVHSMNKLGTESLDEYMKDNCDLGNLNEIKSLFVEYNFNEYIMHECHKVEMNEMLKDARKRGYGVPAPTIWDER